MVECCKSFRMEPLKQVTPRISFLFGTRLPLQRKVSFWVLSIRGFKSYMSVYLQHQKHNKKNLIYPTTLQYNSIGALELKLEGHFYTRGIRLMCFKHSANLLSLVFQMQRRMAPKDNFRRDGLFSFHVQFISENLRQTGLHINEVVLSTEFKM